MTAEPRGFHSEHGPSVVSRDITSATIMYDSALERGEAEGLPERPERCTPRGRT